MVEDHLCRTTVVDHQSILHGSVNGDRFRARKMMKEDTQKLLLIIALVPLSTLCFPVHTQASAVDAEDYKGGDTEASLPVLQLSVS